MVEVTPEMRLARQCAAKYWQTGDPGDEYAARMILSGEWDGEAYVQAALAAIKEVTAASEARIAELEGEVARLRERLQNNHYALEYWERECRVAGKFPAWSEGAMQRGSREIDANRQALKGPTDAK